MFCGSAECDGRSGHHKFVDDFESLQRLEWMVDVLKTEASDAADKERILGEVEAAEGGAQALNEHVSAAISGAVAASFEMRAAPTAGPAIQAALCGEPEQLAGIPAAELAAAVRVAAALDAVGPLRGL
eukprot:SAG22_NODE_761_length_7410_cov_16.687868_6_plen_127_part_01